MSDMRDNVDDDKSVLESELSFTEFKEEMSILFLDEMLTNCIDSSCKDVSELKERASLEKIDMVFCEVRERKSLDCIETFSDSNETKVSSSLIDDAFVEVAKMSI